MTKTANETKLLNNYTCETWKRDVIRPLRNIGVKNFDLRRAEDNDLAQSKRLVLRL